MCLAYTEPCFTFVRFETPQKLSSNYQVASKASDEKADPTCVAQATYCYSPGDADMDALKEKLKAPNLPEQLFGDSLLRLSHEETGVSLSFSAQDALQAWVAEDRQPVRVDVAEEWMKSRERDVRLSGAVSLDYDW